MILLNLFCLCSYFALSCLFLALLYYFNVLKIETEVRYKFNLIDFLLDFIKMSVYDFKHRVPDAFRESGIVVYEGMQGSGKTISMIHDIMVLQHKYPKVKVIDNLGYKFQDRELQHPNDLIDYKNGVYGVITGLDELGVWFNNRNFAEMPKEFIQVIFENRKVRRLLMGTVQRFGTMDKSIRLQVGEVRSCFHFGALTGYVRKKPFVDQDGNVHRSKFLGIRVFIQTTDLRDAYDTYKVIKRFKIK